MDKTTIVLGSKSPRRQALVKELGIPTEVRVIEVEEIYPKDLDPEKVPVYLAELKAQAHLSKLKENEILLTSDTIVLLENEVIGKPKSIEEAKQLLAKLSGKSHTVITGVYLASKSKKVKFSSHTKVHFSTLSEEEIAYYVDKFQPMDKAGSYAIQEWIGYIGVQKIEGCYYNVMGLPLHDVYQHLKSDFDIKTPKN